MKLIAVGKTDGLADKIDVYFAAEDVFDNRTELTIIANVCGNIEDSDINTTEK